MAQGLGCCHEVDTTVIVSIGPQQESVPIVGALESRSRAVIRTRPEEVDLVSARPPVDQPALEQEKEARLVAADDGQLVSAFKAGTVRKGAQRAASSRRVCGMVGI